LNTLEEVDELAVACDNVLAVWDKCYAEVRRGTWGGTYPKENTDTSKYCFRRRKWLRQTCVGITIVNECCLMLTSAMPSPSAPENVNRICTVGSNHFINLSSPLRNSSNACACLRNTFKTASGESQLSRTAANGWVCRSCFVSLLYSFEAASNIRVKLEIERSVG
jgi:hypothetical protein